MLIIVTGFIFSYHLRPKAKKTSEYGTVLLTTTGIEPRLPPQQTSVLSIAPLPLGLKCQIFLSRSYAAYDILSYYVLMRLRTKNSCMSLERSLIEVSLKNFIRQCRIFFSSSAIFIAEITLNGVPRSLNRLFVGTLGTRHKFPKKNNLFC